MPGKGKWITEFGELKIDAVAGASNFLARQGVGGGAANRRGPSSESRHPGRNVRIGVFIPCWVNRAEIITSGGDVGDSPGWLKSRKTDINP